MCFTHSRTHFVRVSMSLPVGTTSSRTDLWDTDKHGLRTRFFVRVRLCSEKDRVFGISRGDVLRGDAPSPYVG